MPFESEYFWFHWSFNDWDSHNNYTIVSRQSVSFSPTLGAWSLKRSRVKSFWGKNEVERRLWKWEVMSNLRKTFIKLYLLKWIKKSYKIKYQSLTVLYFELCTRFMIVALPSALGFSSFTMPQVLGSGTKLQIVNIHWHLINGCLNHDFSGKASLWVRDRKAAEMEMMEELDHGTCS